jgi:hypothetical protein
MCEIGISGDSPLTIHRRSIFRRLNTAKILQGHSTGDLNPNPKKHLIENGIILGKKWVFATKSRLIIFIAQQYEENEEKLILII